MSWRKYPIKFYKNADATIYYENKFMNGTAKDLNRAFSDITNKDLNHELYYYYDDVQEVKIGAFRPAYIDKKYKGRLYLGEIELDLFISDYKGEHTVKNIQGNPELIEKQKQFINKLKREASKQNTIDTIKRGIQRTVSKILPSYLKETKIVFDKAEGLNEII